MNLSQKLFQAQAYLSHKLFCNDKARLAKDWNIDSWRIADSVSAQKILSYRQLLAQSKDFIEKTDFGTGNNKRISVKSLSKSSSISKKNGEILYSIIQNRKPLSILELGTCLGVSTCYLRTGQTPNGKILSIEGCPNTYAARQKHLMSLFLEQQQIEFEKGEFGFFFKTLGDRHFDLVFIDGNHQYQATLDYFKILKERMNPKGLLIFDDIHWSQGMEKAWNKIRLDPWVKSSFDLFQFGIVSN